MDVLRGLRLLVRPDTLLRWHRDLIGRRHAAVSRPMRPGRSRTVHFVRALVLRLARESPTWGCRRVHGELLVLSVKVAACTVWEILREAGIDRRPQGCLRSSPKPVTVLGALVGVAALMLIATAGPASAAKAEYQPLPEEAHGGAGTRRVRGLLQLEQGGPAPAAFGPGAHVAGRAAVGQDGLFQQRSGPAEEGDR
ncbi:hypothetical protein [Streptomyces sp. CA-106110]|uniref:hypothetical protein n=1 Tax=Streptomyces sp. CA-106110 TaxID=3240044 RepID=UPI003D8BA68B